MLPLTTERLHLRPFVAGDVAAVHADAADAEVCRYMEWGPNTLARTQAFDEDTVAASSSAEQDAFTWAITAEGEVVLRSHVIIRGRREDSLLFASVSESGVSDEELDLSALGSVQST